MTRKPRRILAAILLAFFLAAGSFGVFGIAAADGSAPGAFSLPEPWIGDRAAYRVEYTSDGTHVSDVQFELLPVERWRDGEGTWRDVLGVHWNLLDEQGDHMAVAVNYTELLDPSSREGFGVRTDVDILFTLEYTQLVLFTSKYEMHMTGTVDAFGDVETTCGLFTALQQAPHDLQRPVAVQGDCAGMFSYDGVEAIGGVEAVKLVSDDARLWYASHLPYPVRVEQELGEATLTHSLTGFERGSAAIPAAGPPEAAPPPEPVLSAAGRLGPDPAGFAVAFPLEEAWQSAIEHDQADALRGFLATNSEAVIMDAQSFQQDRDTERAYGWMIMLSDGEDVFLFEILRHWDAPLRSLPAPLGQETTVGPPWDSFTDLTRWVEPLWPHPQPDQLPTTLPTAASVAHNWADYSGRSDANVYGFRYWCQDMDCNDVQGAVSAGHDALPPGPFLIGIPGQTTTEEGQITAFSIAADGARLSHSHGRMEHVQSTGGVGAVPAGPPVEQGDSIQLAAGVAWVPPPAAAAAGLTFGAIILAALYWLWPALKGMPALGLFSRLQRHKLLDHPLRSRLMQRVEDEPGIHYQALVRGEGRGRGVIEHHLRHLESAGLVVVDRSAGRACYFPKGTDRRAVAAAVALKAEGTQAVLAAIRAAPGCTAREAGRRAHLSPATVSHHVHKLQEAGLVHAKRGSRNALALYAAA